jgi:hypothetical protein
MGFGIGEASPARLALMPSAGCSSHRAPNYNNSMTWLIGLRERVDGPECLAERAFGHR